MSPEEHVARAKRAELLMQDELIVEFFANSERDYLTVWRDSKIMDQAAREEIWRLLKTLEKFKGHFQSIIANGQLSRHELKEREERARPRK